MTTKAEFNHPWHQPKLPGMQVLAMKSGSNGPNALLSGPLWPARSSETLTGRTGPPDCGRLDHLRVHLVRPDRAAGVAGVKRSFDLTFHDWTGIQIENRLVACLMLSGYA